MNSITDKLEATCERIRDELKLKEKARDEAIKRSRTLIRDCAGTIRAIHRHEWELVETRLEEIRRAADELKAGVDGYPDLYFSGYTRDALKEYTEAAVTYAIVNDLPFPTPDELEVEPDTYLNGLAEAASEMRRHILDIIRKGDTTDEAERLLGIMDTVYNLLMSFDLSDSVTGGIRRQADMLRGVLERTRGDLTLTLRQKRLEAALLRAEASQE